MKMTAIDCVFQTGGLSLFTHLGNIWRFALSTYINFIHIFSGLDPYHYPRVWSLPTRNAQIPFHIRMEANGRSNFEVATSLEGFVSIVRESHDTINNYTYHGLFLRLLITPLYPFDAKSVNKFSLQLSSRSSHIPSTRFPFTSSRSKVR